MSALSPLTRPWYVSAGAALALGAAAWFSTAAGLLEPLDDLVYDALVFFRASVRTESPKVLLLDTGAPEAPISGAVLRDLVADLERLGCSAIVIPSDLLPPGEDLSGIFVGGGRVVVARAARRDREKPDQWILDGREFENLPAGIEWGIAAMPRLQRGVARRYELFASGSQGTYPTAELVAARKALKDPTLSPEGPLLVDFRGGSGSLPRISLERAVLKDVIPEVVRGMCVILGPADPVGPGISTAGGFGGPMSVAEFRGQVVDSLCSSGGIRKTASGLLLGLTLALSLFSALAYRFLNVRGYLRFGACMTVLVLAASALLAVRFGVWMPVAGLCLNQWVLLLGSLSRSGGNLARAMEIFTSDAGSQLREKYWPLLTAGDDPPWPAIAKMVYQTLDVTRMTFFEAARGERRLKYVHGLNVQRADIEERRLDYHRTPYSTAIAQGGPIRVERFFAKPSIDEVQYLCPLLLGDELLGFWAFALDSKKANAIPAFEALIRQYAQRIGDIVYSARRRRGGFERSPLRNESRGGENVETLWQELKGALSLLGDRLKTLENLIDRLEFGVIVFDVFGRVLQINEPMLRALKREGLKPFEMTALDLILNLSDYDLTTARKLMRRVLVEDASVSFPVALRSAGSQRFRVNLKPLRPRQSLIPASAERALRSWGILWEFLDTSSIAVAYELKQELVDHMARRLRNDLGAIGLGSGLLRKRFLLQEQKVRVADLIEKKARRSVEFLSDCGRYLSSRAEEDELETSPVDPRKALKAALDAVGDELAEHKLTVHVDEPFHLGLAVASRTKLEALLRQIVRTLAADSAEGAAIQIAVRELEDSITMEFVNAGFGIPNEVFQEYLHGSGMAIGENFKELREAVETIRRWGGAMEGRSEVGEGMRFEIRLTKFT